MLSHGLPFVVPPGRFRCAFTTLSSHGWLRKRSALARRDLAPILAMCAWKLATPEMPRSARSHASSSRRKAGRPDFPAQTYDGGFGHLADAVGNSRSTPSCSFYRKATLTFVYVIRPHHLSVLSFCKALISAMVRIRHQLTYVSRMSVDTLMKKIPSVDKARHPLYVIHVYHSTIS